MELNENEILTSVAATALEEPTTFTFTLAPRSKVHAFLQRYFPGRYPAKRTMVFKPVTLGVLMQISKILMSIEEDVFDPDDLLASAYNAAVKHMDKTATVIAIACKGGPGEPSKELIQEIIDNFEVKELQQVFSIVLSNLNISGFMTSITLIRGLNLLKVSRKTKGEIIAPGALLEAI